jgi:outer membrane protein TolC
VNAQLSASYIGNALMMDRDLSDWQNLTSPHFGNQFVVDAQQTIYAGGAIDAGIKMAELGVEQAALGMAMNEQNQRFVALSQYLDLQKIAHRQQVLESNIALTQKLIDNIREKHEQGVALKNDITRYELQLETLRLNLVKLQNTRSILNHQLCNTLGLNDKVMIEPTDDAATTLFNKEGEVHWQEAATAVNPQLQMAGVSEQMAHQQVKLAKSELLPKVAIVAQNNFNGPITFELPPVDKNLNIWYVGVGVKYSLSSLFKSNKKLSQARLQHQAATQQKAVAAEQLNNQVQAAYTNYLQSYIELETQQKSVQLAQENYEVVNDRYLNQLALITDMIDASNMKLDAELSEADARINIAYAYYKMKFIAGNL